AGDMLFTLPGFGSSLATIGPDANGAGVVVFQPFDGTTYDPLDVIAQHYTASGSSIAVQGGGTPLLVLVPDMQMMKKPSVSLFSDDFGLLWVATPGQTMGTTEVIVIARAP